MDLKGEIDSTTVVVGNFKNPLTSMDRSSRPKHVNKEIATIHNTVDLLDLIDIYRTFYPKAAEYTFFSSALGTFSNIDHM